MRKEVEKMKHETLTFTDEQMQLTVQQRVYLAFFMIHEFDKADEYGNENELTIDERKKAIETLKWSDLNGQ